MGERVTLQDRGGCVLLTGELADGITAEVLQLRLRRRGFGRLRVVRAPVELTGQARNLLEAQGFDADAAALVIGKDKVTKGDVDAWLAERAGADAVNAPVAVDEADEAALTDRAAEFARTMTEGDAGDDFAGLQETQE